MKTTGGDTVLARTVEWATAVATLLAAVLAAYAVWGVPAPAGAGSVARNETERRVASWAAKEGDVAAAAQAAEEAFHAAVASRSWEALAAVGDDYTEVARLSSDPQTWLPHARTAYLRALFRARAVGSGTGALRVAEAFAALGDRDPVRASLRMADGLAAEAGDVALRRRIARLADRMSVSLEPGRLALLLGRLSGTGRTD
jgi:hypothetical protein